MRRSLHLGPCPRGRRRVKPERTDCQLRAAAPLRSPRPAHRLARIFAAGECASLITRTRPFGTSP